MSDNIFPIKVKEVTIDAVEYERVVQELKEAKEESERTDKLIENIEFFFKRLQEQKIFINSHSKDVFNPENDLFVSLEDNPQGHRVIVLVKEKQER